MQPNRAEYLRRLEPHDLRGSNLRYSLLTLLWRAGRPCSITELMHQLEDLGLVIGGTNPVKTVGDVLRWETTKGRVMRVGRGRYQALPRPESTSVATPLACVTWSTRAVGGGTP